MHFLKATAPGPFRLTPGQTYLMDDRSAGQYLMMAHASDLSPINKWHTREVLTDHEEAQDFFTSSYKDLRLLIIRSGGYGDILMLTPALAELQRRHPQLQISLATHATAACTLPGIQFTPYPVPAETLRTYHAILPLEHLIENDNTHDGPSIFAHALGLHPDPAAQPGFPLRPIYHLTAEATAAAWDRFPKDPRFKHRIGIQINASAANRTYPVNLLQELIEKLLPLQAQIYLFSRPSNDKRASENPAIIMLPNLQDPPDFAQSAALLSTMDLLITPDSALMHLGGALSIPTVALFGPFHWRQRTLHCPSIHALQGVAKCSPCHHHYTPTEPYPKNQPCAGTRFCHALASLTPDRILQKVKQLLS